MLSCFLLTLFVFIPTCQRHVRGRKSLSAVDTASLSVLTFAPSPSVTSASRSDVTHPRLDTERGEMALIKRGSHRTEKRREEVETDQRGQTELQLQGSNTTKK